MEVRDVIAGALEILADEKNWAKNSEYRTVRLPGEPGDTEQSCLWGAFRRVAKPGYYQLTHRLPISAWQIIKFKLVDDAAAEAGKIIREQYPDRIMIFAEAAHHDAIIPFNDHPDTVHADVIAILEKTLAQLSEET